jgi:hypothetical protein
MAIRKPELIVFKRVGLTKEAYDKLRELKKTKRQSMVNIVCHLILNSPLHEAQQ